MPRYKGSCGCYNRQDARELGLAAAIVWNDMLDRSEHFDINPMWYDQKSAAERLGIPERSMNRAVERLVEAGRMAKKRGYRPGTTTQTTWVTVIAEEDDSVGGFRNDDLAVSRNDDLAVSILKETKNNDTELGTAEVDDQKMKPEALYSRVKVFWKGPNELRKQKVAALAKLQEDLSDETIIEGFRLIAKNPTISLSNGDEFTYTLTNMLVRDDLTKTAVNLVKAVEKSQVKKKGTPGGVCY